jgi:lipoate-protein ligase A
LSYALVLKISGELGTIRGANRLVLERHRAALQGLRCGEIRHQGDTDLTLGDLKLSGNSQRRKKNWLLFHGTFLLSADLELMEELLPLPSRQPEYRRQRTHREFLTCLGMSPARLKAGLRLAWSATRALQDVPLEQMSCLVREKYSRLEWNLRVS